MSCSLADPCPLGAYIAIFLNSSIETAFVEAIRHGPCMAGAQAAATGHTPTSPDTPGRRERVEPAAWRGRGQTMCMRIAAVRGITHPRQSDALAMCACAGPPVGADDTVKCRIRHVVATPSGAVPCTHAMEAWPRSGCKLPEQESEASMRKNGRTLAVLARGCRPAMQQCKAPCRNSAFFGMSMAQAQGADCLYF